YSHCLPPRTLRPAAAHASRSADPRLTPCCSLHVAPFCPARRALLSCTSRPAAASASRPTAASVSRSAALRVAPCCPTRRALLQPARRALLQPARRALLRPARRALLPYASRFAAASASRPTAASALCSAALRIAPCCSQRVAPYCSQRVALCWPYTSRPAGASASRPTAASTSRSAALHVAPCCLAQRAPCCPAHRAPSPPSRHAATTAAATAAHATAAAGGGAARSAAGAGGARGATGSAGGAAGAGRATGSAGGAAGAGVVRGGQRRSLPLSDDPTPQQLREWVLQRARPGGGGFGSLRTAQRRQQSQQGTFSPLVLSELVPQRCVTGSVEAAALGASESAAALGASESAAALGASETAATLGARASPATGPSLAEALHTFTLESGVSRCFFCDCTTLTPLAAPIPVSLADPTGGPVVARASTVLLCPAVPSGSLSRLHLPTFSTILVSNAAIQDVWVRWLRRVRCLRLVNLQRLVSFQRLARVRSLPSLPRSPALPRLPCVEGRQRAAPHSSEFPPTTAPLQTLHMDVWGPAPVGATDQERYFLLVVDDYTRYTTVFPLRLKADVSGVLIPWICATRRQLRERFSRDFLVLCQHCDRGGEFSSDLLAEFCRDEGIVQSFTLPASPQQNGNAEHRIGLIMELNLWPRVSEPETSPTLRWTGKVGDASVFRVWGALSLVCNAKTSKLSSSTLRCFFLGFPTDASPWQFYHPRSRRVSSSQDVTFDESVYYYRLLLHASHLAPLAPLFLVPVPPPVDPLPPQGLAPSRVSQVDPPPLVEPLEVSFDSSGPAEGGDPAVDDTAATRRSPRLETPPGFSPWLSSPPPQPASVDFGAETAGAEPGGAEVEGGADSWGVATGGADSGGPASPSGGGAVGDPAIGPGAGQQPQPDLLETLSPQAIHAWIVRRGSPGGGGYGPAGAGAA
ncbi:unnamed protein product, partial [Closterium sp. NIES-53]